MGYLSDALKFETFHTKDLWDRLKKDPKRLVLGVDPWSTKAWNAVLGRDDEPLVDQLGGAYAGHTFSMGENKDGGVYERARAAGVPTEAGGDLQDAAHVIASMYGAQGLGGAAGNVFGGGSGGAQPGLWEQGFAGKTNFSTGIPTNGASAAGIPGIAGPVGGGTGASSAAGMGAQEWAKLGMGLANSAQPQQQGAQPPPPQAQGRNMAQPNQTPTMGQRISGGLGRVGNALFPIDPNTGMSKQQIDQLRTNAMMQMGLGMMGASSRGAGFGESLARGYGLAQGNVQGAMQQAYENAMKNRAENRAINREERDDARLDSQQAHQQWLQEHTLAREQTADERYGAEREYRMEQDKLAQERWKAEQEAQARWREAQLSATGSDKPPSGYRWNATRTGYEFIPGGPADPKTGERIVKPTEGNLAAENYRSRMEAAENLLGDYQPSGTDYFAAMQLYGSDGAGTLSTSIANKFLSPEGQKYYQAAADWVRAKLRKESGAVISPSEMAQEIRTYFPVPGDNDATVKQKSAARDQAAEGMRGMAGVAAPARQDGLGSPPPAVRKSVGGRNYVQINGQWFEDDGTSTGQ